MDRQRFNKLLHNPSLVENNDIRQLNEYRKKYPYFQGLYVIVAKALQERDHPKTDAFIKKAAIYSSNRTHLKTIIEGDTFFEEKRTDPIVKEESQETSSNQEGVKKEIEKAINASPTQTVKQELKLEETEKPKAEKTSEGNKAPEKEAKAEQAEQKSSTVKPNAEIKKQDKKSVENKDTKTSPSKEAFTEESNGDDPVLNELRASKARIDALLGGEVLTETTQEEPSAAQETAPLAPVKPKKRSKPDQVELIEKFIAEDPVIDIRKRALMESEQEQIDLAAKSLKDPDEFMTETMAKLMIKQGKVKKGLDIYKKLGLKFPEKSAYFVTQIQKIKSKHNV